MTARRWGLDLVGSAHADATGSGHRLRPLAGPAAVRQWHWVLANAPHLATVELMIGA